MKNYYIKAKHRKIFYKMHQVFLKYKHKIPNINKYKYL